MGRKLFCELGPLAYKISVQKGIILKNLSDIFKGEKYAKSKSDSELEHIIKSHSSLILRKLQGVDMELQKNKETNLRLAAEKINKTVIKPGETFSLWKITGRPNAKKGYKEGLTISSRKGLGKGVGGGLCQMANIIHWLVLHSPLTVTELHHHSDALFPDEKRRVSFGTGTSIFYNRLDYRFYNGTDQNMQILVWIEDGYLCGELRSDKPISDKYKLVEENHHFRKEGDEYYRISNIYRLITDKTDGSQKKELILSNHSKVLYDHSLIPKEQIRND